MILIYDTTDQKFVRELNGEIIVLNEYPEHDMQLDVRIIDTDDLSTEDLVYIIKENVYARNNELPALDMVFVGKSITIGDTYDGT